MIMETEMLQRKWLNHSLPSAPWVLSTRLTSVSVWGGQLHFPSLGGQWYWLHSHIIFLICSSGLLNVLWLQPALMTSWPVVTLHLTSSGGILALFSNSTTSRICLELDIHLNFTLSSIHRCNKVRTYLSLTKIWEYLQNHKYSFIKISKEIIFHP